MVSEVIFAPPNAPAEISENEAAQMLEIAEKLDGALRCEGIFDIEEFLITVC